MSRRAYQHKRFAVKHHSEPRQPQTPAQEAATQRNFKVFNLRGLHALCYHLTGERRNLAHILIDMELARMGAEPMAAHIAKQAAARDARWAAADAKAVEAEALRAARIEAVRGYGIDLDTAVRVVDAIENPDWGDELPF